MTVPPARFGLWRTLLVTGLVVGPLAAAAGAATVPSAQHPTIQSAINDLAGVPNGSTIDVQPGVYPETLSIGTGRSLTIRGLGGAAVTIIDAAGKGSAAVNVFRAGAVVLRGLTFRNAAVPTASGGGFVVQESSPSFVNCVFELNSAVNGGGGTLITSNATFTSSVIRNNAAAHFGGGVYMTAGSRPVFTNTDIINNVSGTSTFDGAGGGVNAIDASPTFRGSRISNNASRFAAGGIFHMGAFGSPHGRSMLLIEDSEVADNVSTRLSAAYNPSEGGGIHIEDNATASLARVRILRNQAGTGGGLNAYRAQYDVVDSVIDGNQANAPDGFGGGIAATSNNPPPSAIMPASVVHITRSLVRNNMALAADGSLTGKGGGIAVIGDNFSSTKATLQLTSSVVDGNQSSNQGGGVLLSRADMVATGSLVIRNTVTGGSVPFGGGVMVSTFSAATISGTTLARNTAGSYGGGVFLDGDASLDMSTSNVYDNTAAIGNGFGGGGIFVGPNGNNSGQVVNSVIADNTGYQIYENLCPKARLVYSNNTITPRSGNSDLYVTSCAPFQAVSSIGVFEGLGNTSGNNSNAPRFAHFLAAPAAGTGTTIAWSVARATSVTVAGVGTWNTPPTPTTHTADLTPNTSTSYSLTATATGPNGGNYSAVTTGFSVVLPPVVPAEGATLSDFDADSKTDIAVFRPSNGNWYIRYAATGSGLSYVWGGGSDIPVAGDYDGDGKADMAVFRPSNGTWYVRYTATGAGVSLVWGGGSDVPVVGDYDGDGKADMAVFRPSNGTWYVRYTATGTGITLVWGAAGDKPAQDDYDGDGKTDIAVFRPSSSTWYVRYAATGTGITLVWGGTGDVPVQGDYDGDGKADIAVFRVSNGTWYVRYAATGAGASYVWGGGTDIPVPGDFDGDGKTDIAIFRPSTGTWFIRYSSNGSGISLVWGGAGDQPILKRP